MTVKEHMFISTMKYELYTASKYNKKVNASNKLEFKELLHKSKCILPII